MRNLLEYICFLFLSKLIMLWGINNSRKFSSVLAIFFFYIVPIRKFTTIENLKIAFPDLNDDGIKKIAYKSYKSFCTTLIEILHMPAMTNDEIKKQVNCMNSELIKNKYDEHKGVILLSAHFGNWEYVATSVAAQLNLPFSVVVKAQRNPYVTKWLNKMRVKWNNKIIPLGISIRQTYEILKNKNIVAMVADQRGPEEAIKVRFFGRDVSVHTGPAILALKTGAPILYGIPVRKTDYFYETTMTEISTDDLPESYKDKIKEVSQRHMSYLETYIRRYPEQWLWMHKRWKY